MVGGLLKKIFGTKNERTLKELYVIVDEINALESKVQALTDARLWVAKQTFFDPLLAGEHRWMKSCRKLLPPYGR